MSQPTVRAGMQKFTATAAAGAVTIIITWIIKMIWSLEVPGEVQSAFTLLVSLAALYYKPEKYDVSD